MTAQTTIEKIFSAMRIFSPWDFAKSGATTTHSAPYSTDITAVWAMINTDLTYKQYPEGTGVTKTMMVCTAGIKATKYSLYKEFVNAAGKVLGWVKCHGYDGQTISDVADYTTLSAANAAFKAGMDVSGYINKDFAEEVFEEGCDTTMPAKTTNELGAKNSKFEIKIINRPSGWATGDVMTSYSVQNGICKLVINDEKVSTAELANTVATEVDKYCDSFAVISQED